MNDVEFAEAIKANDRIVVKFFANWCGNCRLFSPKFNRMSDSEEFNGVTFLDINAEENPEARKLAGVNNLPFFAVFKNAQLVNAAATSKEEAVAALIKEIL